ncbi:MAG: M48 family metalloprotease [Desulfobacterales bacterium]|nr:M48 family metalloprotease [Desulfobacterales bacterium]
MLQSASKLVALVTMAALLAGVVAPRPLCALTYSKEEEFGREFVKYVETHMEVVQDQYIAAYVESVGQRLLSYFPPQQLKFRFRVIKSDVYNAFAGPGGHIFIHSGLLAVMESEDELAGILGHEIAHVTSRHISQKLARQKKINYVSLAGIVAGILLGASGSAVGAQALTYGTLAAGQSAQLAYSRENELEADEKGLHAIAAAGYDGQGLLNVLQKIRSREWFGKKQIPTYLKTHPATEDRILYIDGWMAEHKGGRSTTHAGNPRGFAMAHARVLALYTDRHLALQTFKYRVEQQPQRAINQYGYGLVLARSGKYPQAISHLEKALRIRPLDPYLQGELGRAYYLGGRYQEAQHTLSVVVKIFPEYADGLFFLGRTYQQLGSYTEAVRYLEALYDIAPRYPRLCYFLGNAHGKLGHLGEAHYYLALYYLRKGERDTARFHLERASAEENDPINKDRIDDLLGKLKPDKSGHQKKMKP